MCFEIKLSGAERAQQEFRQLQQLGGVIEAVLESMLVQPLPRDLESLLKILEGKQDHSSAG